MRMTLTQQISYLRNHHVSNGTLFCNRIIGRAIIHLIQKQPFYGILLAKLSRVPSRKLTSPVGLTWQRQRLVLLYSPRRFAQQIQTGPELTFWLEHEALHIIYLHPVRYPKADSITQIATDVTVNQMIPERVSNEVTLNRLNRRWHLKLPANVNSRFYVTALIKFFKRQQNGHDKKFTNQRIKKILQGIDDHHFWGREPEMGSQVKRIQIKKLIQRSAQDTTAKARGRLPGHVHNQLQRITAPSTVNWRAYVKIGLGGVPFGRQESRARFNRRQAYRMDLMGQISNYVQPVSIFVDNSGSMGDAEIGYLIAQLGNFLKRFPVNVDVYDFDSRVHQAEHYRANNYRQLKFVRVGGGGTCFQSVFDYCHHHLQTQQKRLIIILTDGYGEGRLNYYGFGNLLWILTRPKNEFSVKNRRGHIVSLYNDPKLKNLENK